MAWKVCRSQFCNKQHVCQLKNTYNQNPKISTMIPNFFKTFDYERCFIGAKFALLKYSLLRRFTCLRTSWKTRRFAVLYTRCMNGRNRIQLVYQAWLSISPHEPLFEMFFMNKNTTAGFQLLRLKNLRHCCFWSISFTNFSPKLYRLHDPRTLTAWKVRHEAVSIKLAMIERDLKRQ